MTVVDKGRIRVGVIGVGSLGQWHAKVYSQMPGAALVGVYDVEHERAVKIAGSYGGKAFETMDALAEEVDAVSVVVPTDRHHEVFLALAARGLHMLVEKPIAATMAQAGEMIRVARECSLVLQVGHVERFNPVMRFLEDHLKTPRFIEAIRLAPYPAPRAEGPPRGTEVSVVFDLMIHDLEIILHLVNSPIREIHAIGVPVLSTTEDIANVRLVFQNGCVANVTASRISQERMRKIRVFQSDTYVSLDYMNQAGQLCRKTAKGIEVVPVPIEKGEPLAAELASFIQCVRTRKDPVVSGVQASEALRLAAEICGHIQKSPS